MRLVFVVTSFWAYGELLIAFNFANQLKEKCEVLFLVPPSHKKSVSGKFKYILLIPNSRNLNRIIITEIREKFRPNLVVLSDFLNYAFAHKHYGLLLEDLELFRCKIATFDNFDWKLKRSCMDTYGFISDIPKKVNIDDYGSRIIPCPIADPTIKRENEFRFSLITDNSKKAYSKKKNRKAFFEQQHIEERSIVLISYAKWQENYAKSDRIDRFIEVSNKLFDRLIIELAKSYIVISIGERRQAFEGVSNILMFESVPADVFNEYADMADLYVGKNITSTSMINIVMSGTPCVNIINSHERIMNRDEIACIIGEDISDMTNEYKYMMYPVGWYEFLKPLFANNFYSELVTWCELFDFSETLLTCHKVISDTRKKEEQKKKLNFFKEKLNELQNPQEIVSTIITEREN